MSGGTQQATDRLVSRRREALTVSSAAVGFSSAKYNPAGTNLPNDQAAKRAECQVLDDTIRYTKDGTAPTSTTGFQVTAGQDFVLRNIDEISRFQAIRDTGATGDAIITADFLG
ncbi:hypothetical protein CMI37_35395 [Candidatus Pacearchaeota archaeon]|nr:hypothetical protein [Candidatus Pacearchaeota archaeon]|tara:strand:- start:151 stop:492 length:342 start_codon:yes stop_codon:yes gene_type:complete